MTNLARSPSPLMASRQGLAIMRAVLGSGPIIFGVVCWFLRRQPGTTPTGSASPLSYMAVVLSAFAIAAAIVIRGQLVQVTDLKLRAPKLLAAWVIGEAAALFGVITFFMSGDATWFVVSLIAMLAAFIIVPIQRGD